MYNYMLDIYKKNQRKTWKSIALSLKSIRQIRKKYRYIIFFFF